MKQNKYLICRIDRIGDVVLSTPLPREIKKNQPNSFVAVLVRNYTKDIYLNNPYVDQIITYDREDNSKKNFWKLVKELKKYNFNYGFMLLPDERLNYILFFTGIKNRIGVGHKLYQFLTVTKYIDRHKYIPIRHESDYCLDMLRKINLKTDNIAPEIFLTENDVELISNKKSTFIGNKKKLIGINTSSGNSAPNLNVFGYKRLIALLQQNREYQIAIMDKVIPLEITDIPDVVYPNVESNLRNSILNFATLDLLISNSTGPMHICSALKVPTLSLFCPLTACSPKLWGPLGNVSKIVLPEKEYCDTQCPVDPKKCDYSRPGGLTAEKIMNYLNEFIKYLKWE